MRKEGYVLFDVCNDYTLDKANDQNMSDAGYRKKILKGDAGIVLWYHREYNELHYAEAPESYQGKMI